MAIRNVQSANVTTNSFDVIWDTDEIATTAMLFKVKGSNPCSLDGMIELPSNGHIGFSHTYNMVGLDPGTSYCAHPKSLNSGANNLPCGDVSCIIQVDTAPLVPSIASVESVEDIATGDITFTINYVDGPSTAFCFMWRYKNGDDSSPLIYYEGAVSDTGSTIIVAFNPYTETRAVPTDGAIEFNVLVAPGACDTPTYEASYTFSPPEPEQKPVAPPAEQNPNFYQGAFNEALALFRIRGGIR